MTLLVGDIGGTNSRFGLAGGDDHRPYDMEIERGDDHATFEDAVAAYLEKRDARPDRAVFAIAGPVAGRAARLTNRGAWSFDADALEKRFGLQRVDLVNDFVAQAASLPYLDASELAAIGDAQPTDATKAALGPGTGLGVAGLMRDGERWIPIPSEGGHIELAATNEREAAIVAIVRRSIDRVSAETLNSGIGMPRLHAALAELDGRAVDHTETPKIVAAAQAGEPAAVETATLFLTMFARFAGDMALVFGARGGVYVCGGVVPRLKALIDPAAFRAAFEAKSPHEAMMREIATILVSSDVSGLIGCAATARNGP
ncbi:glucokinase [Hansschlegelia quercus]|uniref:Glucokinase n=1 Tax=Hansschlegelia quercus TaxID=2528245 RepID=A0A4Q9GQA0_9HYPH|nr:glucokinase [Hansschlegelia quercus]TBN53837.1 glucokinase [Hansschlegelia quercus]